MQIRVTIKKDFVTVEIGDEPVPQCFSATVRRSSVASLVGGERVDFEVNSSELLSLVYHDVKAMEIRIDESGWDYDSDPGDSNENS